MIRASYNDKSLVVDILSKAFDSNKSINFIAKQDAKRSDRIKILMEYSFEICYLFGTVYLSEDKKACALILYPEKKSTTLKSIYWNIKLIFQCIGMSRIGKIRKREALIKNNHPKTPIYYLWFLAVHPDHKKQGIGNALLKSVIEKSIADQKNIYLETSTLPNVAWYQQFNFKVIQELDLGYQLFILKRTFLF